MLWPRQFSTVCRAAERLSRHCRSLLDRQVGWRRFDRINSSFLSSSEPFRGAPPTPVLRNGRRRHHRFHQRVNGRSATESLRGIPIGFCDKRRFSRLFVAVALAELSLVFGGLFRFRLKFFPTIQLVFDRFADERRDPIVANQRLNPRSHLR